MTVNVGRPGPDGKTAWEHRHGRPFKKRLASFGEAVDWLPGGKRQSRLPERWHRGIYYGIAETSDDHLVADASGVGLARSRTRARVGWRRPLAPQRLGVSNRKQCNRNIECYEFDWR